MIVIPHISFFESYISSPQTSESIDVATMIFNPNIRFLITKEYLTELEGNVSDPNIFQGLLVYLSDNDKIEPELIPKKEDMPEFVNITNNTKKHFCYPITLDDTDLQGLKNLVNINAAAPKNREWILVNLFKGKIISLNHYDFDKNSDVKEFFNNLIKLPNFTKNVLIFNREIDSTYLQNLKGKNIFYYSYLEWKNRIYFHEELSELRLHLGQKLRLFVEHNKRNIHERKIFIDDLVITIDNSLKNLVIEEATWSIFVEYNPICKIEWSKKINKFKTYSK
jgi:hypothetical protein